MVGLQLLIILPLLGILLVNSENILTFALVIGFAWYILMTLGKQCANEEQKKQEKERNK